MLYLFVDTHRITFLDISVADSWESSYPFGGLIGFDVCGF